jgi:hypothetical protein
MKSALLVISVLSSHPTAQRLSQSGITSLAASTGGCREPASPHRSPVAGVQTLDGVRAADDTPNFDVIIQ